MLELFAEIEINATTPKEQFHLISYVYYTKLSNTNTLKPSDDISGIKEMDISKLPDLVKEYEDISGDLVVTKEDYIEYKHSWKDYGKIYAPIHQIAYEWLINRS
jgi:hypothetical protein